MQLLPLSVNVVNISWLSNSSLSLPLNDSIYPFSQGLPRLCEQSLNTLIKSKMHDTPPQSSQVTYNIVLFFGIVSFVSIDTVLYHLLLNSLSAESSLSILFIFSTPIFTEVERCYVIISISMLYSLSLARGYLKVLS
jgi:hypothetical protein